MKKGIKGYTRILILQFSYRKVLKKGNKWCQGFTVYFPNFET